MAFNAMSRPKPSSVSTMGSPSAPTIKASRRVSFPSIVVGAGDDDELLVDGDATSDVTVPAGREVVGGVGVNGVADVVVDDDAAFAGTVELLLVGDAVADVDVADVRGVVGGPVAVAEGRFANDVGDVTDGLVGAPRISATLRGGGGGGITRRISSWPLLLFGEVGVGEVGVVGVRIFLTGGTTGDALAALSDGYGGGGGGVPVFAGVGFNVTFAGMGPILTLAGDGVGGNAGGDDDGKAGAFGASPRGGGGRLGGGNTAD
jgi:hypothetical protein